MKPKVYLETTIPSLLVARPGRDLIVAADQQTTLEWWDTRRGRFQLFVSELVLEEAAKGDRLLAGRRLAAIAPCGVLKASDAARLLTVQLLASGLIPGKAAADAAHIALAAVHGFSSDVELPAYCQRHDRGSSARAVRPGRLSGSGDLHSL